MGAPIVRRDELEELRADFEKYKKANARKANASAKDPDKAFVTREGLRAEFVKFAQALGIAPMPEDIPEDSELEDSAGKDPELEIEGLSDPDGIALVEAIHERKQEGAE